MSLTRFRNKKKKTLFAFSLCCLVYFIASTQCSVILLLWFYVAGVLFKSDHIKQLNLAQLSQAFHNKLWFFKLLSWNTYLEDKQKLKFWKPLITVHLMERAGQSKVWLRDRDRSRCQPQIFRGGILAGWSGLIITLTGWIGINPLYGVSENVLCTKKRHSPLHPRMKPVYRDEWPHKTAPILTDIVLLFYKGSIYGAKNRTQTWKWNIHNLPYSYLCAFHLHWAT